MLYDAGNVPLAERSLLTPSEIKAIAQADFDEWYSGAKEFYTSAISNLNLQQLKVSVFNLHQAAETKRG
jgi:hypothetical protein